MSTAINSHSLICSDHLRLSVFPWDKTSMEVTLEQQSSPVQVKQEQSSSSIQVEQLSSSTQVEQPSSSIQVKQLSLPINVNLVQPSSSSQVKKLSYSKRVKKSSSSIPVKQPISSIQVKLESSSSPIQVKLEPPSSPIQVKKSTLSRQVKQPSSVKQVKQPSSSRRVSEPLSSIQVKLEPPLSPSPVKLEPPSSPLQVKQEPLSSPIQVRQPSSPIKVRQLSSPIQDTLGFNPSGQVKATYPRVCPDQSADSKTKKKMRCVVADCINKGRHRFPKNEVRRRQWIEAIKHVKPGMVINGHSQICSDHFQISDFSITPSIWNNYYAGRILRKTVVPSVFLWNKTCDKKSSIQDALNFNPDQVITTYSRAVLPTVFIGEQNYMVPTVTEDPHEDPLTSETPSSERFGTS